MSKPETAIAERATPAKAKEFLNIDFRDELRAPQQRDDIDISADELLDILASFTRLGLWRVNIDLRRTTWSEDVYAIHNMEYTPGRIALDYAIEQYHPDDRQYLSQLIEDTIANKSGFQFVLRLKARQGRYKLVRSIGNYREREDGTREIIGTFSEFQPAHRMIGAVV